MKRQSLMISMIFFLVCALFCTDAFAKKKDTSETGIDAFVNMGPTFALFTTEEKGRSTFGESSSVTRYTDWFIGGNASVNIGYRWSVIGVYLTQDMGFMKLYDNNDPENTMSFLGGTYLTAKVLLGSDNISFDIGLGLGAMYDNTKKKKYYIIANESRAAFAIKLSLDFTYFIFGFLGLGIDFTYNAGIMEWNVDGAYIHDYWDTSRNGFEYEKQSKIHQLSPGIHVRIRL